MAPAKAAADQGCTDGSYPGRSRHRRESARLTKLRPLSRSSRSVRGSVPSRSTAALSGRLALAGSAGRTSCPTAPRSEAWSLALRTWSRSVHKAKGQLNEDP